METLDVQQLTVLHTEQQLRAKEYHAEREEGGHDRKPRQPLHSALFTLAGWGSRWMTLELVAGPSQFDGHSA